MKKISFFIIATILIFTGVFYFQPETHSAIKLPVADSCRQAYFNGIDALQEGWRKNLQTLVDQPTQTSDLIDDAFENYRTLECWLNYFCESVEYSGLISDNQALVQSSASNETLPDYVKAALGKSAEIKPKKKTEGRTFGTEELGRIPGCADPEDVELPQEEWGIFLDSLGAASAYKDRFKRPSAKDKFTYIPQCSSQEESIQRIADAIFNSQECEKRAQKLLLNVEDSNSSAQTDEAKNESEAFIILEKALIHGAGEKRNTALEQKLLGITTKLQSMKDRHDLVKTYFLEFDNRIPCFLKECTP